MRGRRWPPDSSHQSVDTSTAPTPGTLTVRVISRALGLAAGDGAAGPLVHGVQLDLAPDGDAGEGLAEVLGRLPAGREAERLGDLRGEGALGVGEGLLEACDGLPGGGREGRGGAGLELHVSPKGLAVVVRWRRDHHTEFMVHTQHELAVRGPRHSKGA